ncbi:sulfonate ABC transporter substrate-binding protein [Niveibacterium sp. SC-1]|uniref:sulfonate ABC transporter substrate-binding protein n=1 Tax=Niveibacterium sp. SC-1 TaxID=3135646 RepID=UPI00311E9289
MSASRIQGWFARSRSSLSLVFAVAASFLVARTAIADESAPAQIRIGFQKSSVNLVVLKQRAVLEQRFKDARISWIEFPAGPQLLEALAVGSLDFGMTGDTPPVFAQAAGKDPVYVAVEPPKPESSAILVPGDSPIRSLADLKGKRVALQKGSSSHFLLVRALDKAGLKWSDISPAWLTPAEARAAFERGSVDAWAIWDPYYAAAEYAVKPRVLTSGTGLSSNNSFYLAARPFVTQYPATVAALIEELRNADAWVQADRKRASQLISEFSGLELGVVYRFVSRRPVSPPSPLTASAIAEQQKVAESFQKLALIPAQPFRVADAVWTPGKPLKLAQESR